MLRLRRDHKIAVLNNGARLPAREGAGLGAARPTPLSIYEIKNQEREDNDMKKIKRQILTLMMALMVMFTMMPNTVEAAAKKNVTVSVSTKKLAPKKSAQLKVKYGKKNVTKKAKYKTSNKKVLTVNKKGKITAKKVGKATITVRYGKKTKKVKFTIVKPAAAKKTAANKGSDSSHTHKWVKKTKTEKNWVPKMVEEDIYETVYEYRELCICGDIIPMDDSDPEALKAFYRGHDKKHQELGIPVYSSLEIVGEKKVKVGTKTVDRGHYEDVPCGTYYQCACGAVK
jgi:Bacterial Ig-like domain (group 2).